MMETRIQKTLRQWFPEAFTSRELDVEMSDYEILRQFAAYARELMDVNAENRKEPFKIIFLLYSKALLSDKKIKEAEP